MRKIIPAHSRKAEEEKFHHEMFLRNKEIFRIFNP